VHLDTSIRNTCLPGAFSTLILTGRFRLTPAPTKADCKAFRDRSCCCERPVKQDFLEIWKVKNKLIRVFIATITVHSNDYCFRNIFTETQSSCILFTTKKMMVLMCTDRRKSVSVRTIIETVLSHLLALNKLTISLKLKQKCDL